MFSLVAVIAWTTAAQGGTRAVDLGIVTVLLLTALLGSTGRVGRLGRSPTLLSVLVLEVWLIAAGTRGGTPVDLVSLRVPAVVLVVVLTVCIAARLDSRQRAVVIDCVVVVGVVQACTAIEQVVLESWSTGSLTPASRPVGLLGNANALGILLVATAALTLRASLRSPSRVTGAALAVQGGALLLTASRLALIAAALVLVSCLRIPRRRWVAAAAAYGSRPLQPSSVPGSWSPAATASVCGSRPFARSRSTRLSVAASSRLCSTCRDPSSDRPLMRTTRPSSSFSSTG